VIKLGRSARPRIGGDTKETSRNFHTRKSYRIPVRRWWSIHLRENSIWPVGEAYREMVGVDIGRLPRQQTPLCMGKASKKSVCATGDTKKSGIKLRRGKAAKENAEANVEIEKVRTENLSKGGKHN